MHTRPPVPVFGAVRRGPPFPNPRQRGAPAMDGVPAHGTSGCRFLVSPELVRFMTFSGLTGFSSGIYPYGGHGAL